MSTQKEPIRTTESEISKVQLRDMSAHADAAEARAKVAAASIILLKLMEGDLVANKEKIEVSLALISL